MTEPTRLLIHGASGRMGQALLRLAAVRDDLRVVAAASRGQPDSLPAGVQWLPPAGLAGAPEFDVAIDFSLPEAFDAVLALAVSRCAGFVSGTTGIGDAQRSAFATAASGIPVVWAANFSLGVAVLSDLVERAARMLDGWDCDIVESHHIHKKDAPSGTALALGGRAEAGGGAPRYASIRAGDIAGEHTVQFATAGERIELIHRATNRDIFARGALHVARRLHGRAAGAYGVADLLD
jgi:4-hydroxy-tetrahydrodipicolinate reductase